MAEYIEREAAYDDMLWAMCGTGYQTEALRVITRAPAADVAPVVHGRWEDGRLCSVCDFDRSYFRPHFNYCPNCGAKMDMEDTP